MKPIKLKAIVLTASTFTALLLVIGALNFWAVQPTFKRLEQARAVEDSTRVRAALTNELQQLNRTLGDWALWDSAYAFAKNHDANFVPSNFRDWPTLEKTVHFNLCLILDVSGRVLYVGGYDSDSGGDVIPADFVGDNPAIKALLQPVLEKNQTLSGLLSTERGLLLFAARPILSSDGSGPASGIIALGQFLDHRLLRNLRQQTWVEFTLFTQADYRLSPEEQALWRTLTPGVPQPTSAETPTFLYERFDDLYGQPVALIRTPIRHEISHVAQNIGHALIGILGLTLLTLLLGGVYGFSQTQRHETPIAPDMMAWGVVTLVVLVGLGLTLGIFLELRRNSWEALERQFRFVSAERARTVMERFRNNLRDLDAVRRFYEGSPRIKRADFHQFVTPILNDHGFLALEWLPKVKHAQRVEFEKAAQNDGFAHFVFRECDGTSLPDRATDRAEYFPVYYVEPHAVNQAAFGCVSGTTHPMDVIRNQARDSGQITLSERHTLPEMAEQSLILAVAPVYRHEGTIATVEERRRQLQGFIVGVMPIGDVVDNALLDSESHGLILRLLDQSATHEQQLLDVRLPRVGSPQPALEPMLLHQMDFSFANRIWRIESQPNTTFIANTLDPIYRWVPIPGFLLTFIAALYLFTVIYQHRRAEMLVMTRTAELRASEARFRALHEASFGGISIHDQGIILECNQGLVDLTGFPLGALIGMNCLRLIAPKWQHQVIQNHRDGDEKSHQVEGLRKDGTTYPLEIQSKNIPYQGRTVRVTEFRDISERKQAEQRLRLAGAVFEGAQELILVTDRHGHILAVNPAFTRLSGYTEAEVLGRNPRFLQSDHHAETYFNPESYFTALWQTVDQQGAWQGEFRGRNKNGHLFTVLVTVSAVYDAEQITHYVAVATDVTHLREAEQRIEHLAYYDTLTNLPNRTLLAQRAVLALAQATRRNQSLALLLLDLDRFKEINDSLGHVEGDALLVQAALRIAQLVGHTDTLCRVGGDEFVLLLPETGASRALTIAEQLISAFHQPFTVAGHSLRATVSIGIAVYPQDGATFDDLLKNADTALYRAKQEGRNHAVSYAREMNVATFERLMLESELRKAIETGQLRAYYQPKVRLADGVPVGAEALVRWHHPEHGLIPPGRFVPVAEASDLIVALGNWMLADVCRQLAVWQAAGLPPLSVAVNLAARHFRDPKLIERIEDLLSTHGLAPKALELELTESTLLENGAQTVETLQALQRLGVGLAIDDFGTGYSSLGYLKRLPISALKIDQGFVRDLVTDADDRVLAATIVTLGHSLGLDVVAEGVETEQQQRFLIEQGCDFAQGYLFSRPLTAEAFVEWLNDNVAKA